MKDEKVDDVSASIANIARTTAPATMRAWTRAALQDMARPRRAPRVEYDCDRSLLAPELQARFVQLDQDDSAKAFLATCRPCSVFTVAAFNLLRQFWSITDTNAWLGGGQMHVISQAQAATLLDLRPPAVDLPPPPPQPHRRRRLLDVGAGDGNVTRHLAPLFDEVVATEVSPGMVKRLQARGYAAVQTGDVTAEGKCRRVERRRTLGGR